MVIPSELSKSTLYEVPKQVLTKKLRKDFLSSRHFVRVLISKISCETSQNLQRNKDISRRCLTCQPFWTQFLAKNNFRARLRRCHHVFTFNSDYKKHINPAWDSLTCQFLFTCAFERHGHSILKWQPKQQILCFWISTMQPAYIQALYTILHHGGEENAPEPQPTDSGK
jgi:hypothetical protein